MLPWEGQETSSYNISYRHKYEKCPIVAQDFNGERPLLSILFTSCQQAKTRHQIFFHWLICLLREPVSPLLLTATTKSLRHGTAWTSVWLHDCVLAGEHLGTQTSRGLGWMLSEANSNIYHCIWNRGETRSHLTLTNQWLWKEIWLKG